MKKPWLEWAKVILDRMMQINVFLILIWSISFSLMIHTSFRHPILEYIDGGTWGVAANVILVILLYKLLSVISRRKIEAEENRTPNNLSLAKAHLELAGEKFSKSFDRQIYLAIEIYRLELLPHHIYDVAIKNKK